MERISIDNMEKKGITGSTLKLIAIVTMLIDHIAAVVLDGYLLNAGFYDNGIDFSAIFAAGFTKLTIIFWINMVMRLIGRLAFPLFCFLLVEGFFYTKSRAKYALRLFLFALISEIPFDMALGFSTDFRPEFHNQNVYFTLLIGLLTIWGLEQFKQWWYFRLSVVLAAILLAILIQPDYGIVGVAAIAFIYQFRKKSNTVAMTAGCAIMTACQPMEITSFFDVYLVHRYNGRRGLKLKYVFYLFYPVHLLILYWIKIMIIG